MFHKEKLKVKEEEGTWRTKKEYENGYWIKSERSMEIL